MGKTQASEKDRPDLERLEQIVKDAGHAGIGTAELSEKSASPQQRSGACSTITSPERSEVSTPTQKLGYPQTAGFINRQRMTSQPRIERSRSDDRRAERISL
jgi:hypothetical protein